MRLAQHALRRAQASLRAERDVIQPLQPRGLPPLRPYAELLTIGCVLMVGAAGALAQTLG